ncbi:MAG TPA: T9SS type A sorting domain-containing protein, partial [Cryomorphaceae bacterium]|nr:T9SS type A sorting domain-containing protein [Cryomorphaceae bacterium]
DPYDGEGFAGVIIFNNQDGVEESYREPIGVELIEPLIAGNTYQVEFSIVRMYSQPTTLSANNFGFKFTNTPTFSVDSLIIDNTAAFKIDTVISDTTNWLTVSAQFEADSAYSYVHFGNFYENDSTVFLADTDIGIYAYLALDAISITEVPTTSQEDLEKPNFRVFPNPSSNRLTVKSGLGIVEIRIFNSNGVLIEKFQGNDNLKIEIDIGRIKTGFYFLEISTPKFNYYEKIIKI